MAMAMWKVAATELGFDLRWCYQRGTPPFTPTRLGKDQTGAYWRDHHVDYVVLHTYAIQKLCLLEDRNPKCLKDEKRLLGVPEPALEPLGAYRDRFRQHVMGHIARYRSPSLKKLFIVVPEPVARNPVANCVQSNPKDAFTRCSFPAQHYDPWPFVKQWLEELAAETDFLELISVEALFCPNDVCPGTLPTGEPLWKDRHHPMPSTWLYYANNFFRMLQRKGLQFVT
jgi:hypothetical protein